MTKLRVLVVEDSLTVRMHLCELLEADPAFELVGQAEDGKQAIELCLALRPDVISLDMMMPVMTGLAATEYIMAYCPTPILVVSSSINRGELFRTYEALAAGALDVIEKPQPGQDRWDENYLAMLKLVAKVKVVTHLRGRRAAHAQPIAPCAPASPRQSMRLVALGASTGGASALVEVLGGLPVDFPLPLVVVIHLAEPFGHAFVDWLDDHCLLDVRLARHGQALPARGVVMAAPGLHLQLRGGMQVCEAGPERLSCRPSVDVLFESVAQEYGAAAAAVLLTGMGQDGARGMLAVRDAGGLTIAQDEASCVVYGMPREAALLNAAQRILPLSDIGPALAALGAGRMP
ncbi:chemotaxis response regulator protein-glutamate methylesterase [Chromobacterium sp. ATCC 53434]|uniref:chemotaxis-specific protein-glutamate methyltransferase CheB n=1 Tax=Chromobacterium sp. (strain ATCC 53434 / SC 14030) TaxID=2059672 RepID=UPI000C781B6F|nr:chemotaxis-specific protein-glutamate methyltransferase CheB [Chromobacterium sp. ATCC 53434]AUH50680.1 chemotaxis response regulator protein-glutamate methylesterase [Chromobacterium sp. ATCC 53434]